ncbi:NAD(P)/FAD-dependent oxidoreductase [Sedimentimonas flavescens]|uniref:NAD(P)/FAD-dependent oxidoreductase n=1 Tax=Sedimentimonas flavescens TaxID=2851012 RepID=UPI001F2AB7E7|nr:FAD-dependent oxidoreductase [Sedimentimonas flavescens]
MLKHIYEPAAYAAQSLDGCYWVSTAPQAPDYAPLAGEARVEFAVIGGGFTGLSAALRLAEAGVDVAVLDMHAPGWGASGRNGGFCCMGGSKASGATLLRRYGADELARHRAAEVSSIETVADIAARYGIELDRHSEGEVQLAHRPAAFEEMRAEAATLARELGCETRLIGPTELAAEGLAAQGMHGALHVRLGFGLNPRKYVLGLAEAVTRLGGRIHAHSTVEQITRAGEDYVLRTSGGTLRARHILLATNGYSSDNLPDWMRARYLPVQSSVIVTRPLSDDEIAAQGWSSDLMAYDSRNLLHYFRLMPNRQMLFGMRGGVRWTPADHAAIRREIRRDFDTMFPAWRAVEAPWFWSGLANLARDLVPFVGQIGDWPRAFASFAYHGNGVAMGTWCGAQMADLALGRETALPDFYRTPPKRFELGPARRLALIMAYHYYKVMDGK